MIPVEEPSAVPASRRELNKAATRRAIAEAALALLRARGVGRFTVEDIASAAGVSRRTFFNYFPSREAALAVSVDEFLDHGVEQFLARPADEPLVESMHELLIALADPIHLAAMAEVYGTAGADPQMHRFQLEGWDSCADKLVEAIRGRSGPEMDSLYVGALVGSALSCGKAALSEWFHRCGGEVTEESLDLLRQYLIDVVGYLRQGFTR
ncbi:MULTISPECIES: TetR family transcriptional regulator [Kocuria]|uniref:TetR family transcriptional regulator n=1 Tax=Kocuria TaxID=57493 RepID=UPI000BAB589B|nr:MULTISPECIES: TetR family transcriptional regulator [Kocuria]NVC25433.1 TetR family transcriptional regulator [Kocuria salina]MEB2529104.1 TetR family transcriptional regulator [Kocuria rosea]PAU85086.1 TetR family transcriptional regulator [Kocuria sp. WN036]THE18662.1 TetR family transcriptional regulator [Kocuria rosea]WJZ66899.1 TetR family transcriptional regulator [Kocuria rosea]